MDLFLNVCLGVGLAAACGFRVFVPFLALSIASRAGAVELAPAFGWLGSDAALVTLAVASLLEIAAYYVPWVDNALDAVASPAAVIAGAFAMGSVVTGLDPFVKWTLVAIAGGGVAGIVQAATVGSRKVSLLTTAGLANPVVSTIELGGSVVMSLMAILLPVLAVLLLVGLFALFAIRLARLRRKTA
jgi:hypothetical protein